jgi:HemY protein
MLRTLKFILVAAMFLALAWWIGGLPGNVVAHSGAYTVETSVPAALLILFLLALTFVVLLRVLGGIRRAPGGFFMWRGGRRRRLGESAMHRGIVALAAGDAAAARNEAARARKYLGDTPLALLMAAEAAERAGRPDEAKAVFERLVAHRDLAFLGHRGLLRHSFALGDHDAAHRHALAAEDVYPGSAWVKDKRLSMAVAKQDFAAALGFAHTPAQVAACATAAAAASTDQRGALGYAKQAVKADPTLAPAVAALASILRGLGKPRAAKRVLLRGWAVAPNPLIAAAFLQPVKTPIERAQAAAELAAVTPGHPESSLILAETALEAQLTGEARRHAEAAATVDDGRAKNILAALDGAPVLRAPIQGWECSACHNTYGDWTVACANCGEIGGLAWSPTRVGRALVRVSSIS